MFEPGTLLKVPSNRFNYAVNYVHGEKVVVTLLEESYFLQRTTSLTVQMVEGAKAKKVELSEEQRTASSQDLVVSFDGRGMVPIELSKRYMLHARNARVWALNSSPDEQAYGSSLLFAHIPGQTETVIVRTVAYRGEGLDVLVELKNGGLMNAWVHSSEFTGLLEVADQIPRILNFNLLFSTSRAVLTTETGETIGNVTINPDGYWNTDWEIYILAPAGATIAHSKVVRLRDVRRLVENKEKTYRVYHRGWEPTYEGKMQLLVARSL